MISLLSFFRFVISFLLNIAFEVLTLNQIGDIILLVVLLALTTGLVLLHVLVALGELAERGKAVGAKLVQDPGNELGEFLLLAVTVEGEGVGGDGGVDSGSTEVDNVAILLEHVDLLDGLNGLDIHLLEGGLELLVVGAGALVDLLDLAAGSTLASVGSLVDCFGYGIARVQVFGVFRGRRS